MDKKIIENVSSWEVIPILDSIKDAVFIDDKDGFTLWCNQATLELYKLNRDDIIGVHVSKLEELGIFSNSVAIKVIQEKKEVTIIHKNMEGKQLLTTGSPIFDEDGNLSKIITTSRDITELVELQTKIVSYQETIDEIKSVERLSERGIITKSQSMYNVMQLAKKLATVDSTVLITGESGVGKSLIAELLHESGDRKDHPFITVNCGAIPEALMESELFGYEKGAFTGARSEGKTGLFEAAQKGTIFLDEISELPLPLQVKLLQVIQQRQITKVGGTKEIPIDVRIISATNKDLQTLVLNSKFREDLYYRLNVVPINVPPLRERYEDILPLINLFLEKYNERYDQNKTIEPTALAMLMKFDWPGNIRELQNIIERLVITTTSNIVTIDHLPSFISANHHIESLQNKKNISYKNIMEKAEKALLIEAIKEHKTTREIAKALEISQPSVVRKLAKHNIKL